jgi:hypothetical protein
MVVAAPDVRSRRFFDTTKFRTAWMLIAKRTDSAHEDLRIGQGSVESKYLNLPYITVRYGTVLYRTVRYDMLSALKTKNQPPSRGATVRYQNLKRKYLGLEP